MLNKNKERELAYIVTVDAIEPIPGKDRVECARVGGWTCMVPKGSMKAGDPAVYIEIDSLVPLDNDVFSFCERYHGKIKTQKFRNPDGSQFWSQGLLMAVKEFGWCVINKTVIDDENKTHVPDDESRFLTKKLGITYYEAEDNKRKAESDPYAPVRKALNRHPKIAKKYGKFIKNHKFAQKIFMLFFGRKKDKKSKWPAWVTKTDEERVQNMPWILNDKNPWIATEKIDGTSTTFTAHRTGRKKIDYYVCSRNVVFDTPDKPCFYNKNVYFEMFEKYNIKDVLTQLLEENPKAEWVTIQGETYGKTVQKRDYSLEGRDFMAFNLVFSHIGRVGTVEMSSILWKKGVPCVPILDANFILPDTVEELLNIATGYSAVDNKPREGIVFRSPDGTKSFKAVSNEFLAKYHG